MSEDLARFLADRYDEAEQEVNDGDWMGLPERRQADIKLKRAILAEHRHYDESAGSAVSVHFGCELCHWHSEYGIPPGVDWCATVRQLGTEFTSHPAYRPEWAPEGAAD